MTGWLAGFWRFWLPGSQIRSDAERNQFLQEDKERIVRSSGYAGFFSGLLLLLHWLIVDFSLGTHYLKSILIFRLGLGTWGLLLAAASYRGMISKLQWPRLPLLLFGASISLGQALIMSCYPAPPVWISGAVALVFAYSLFFPAWPTALCLLITLVLQYVLLVPLGNDRFALLSCDAMLLFLAVALRSIQNEPRTFQLRGAMEENRRLRSLQMVAEGVAHDILNPLNFIPNASTLIVDAARRAAKTADPQVREDALGRCEKYHKVILHATQRAAEAIESLRRCAQGTQSAEAFVEIDLNAVVSEAAALVDQEQKIILNLQPLSPIVARRAELHRVLLNLIINAQQSGGAGVVIRLNTHDAAANASLVVRDNGPGIPADILGRIFEPYFTTKPTGRGLGLAVAQAFAQAHGGQLLAENDGGAVFTLRLPHKRPQA